MNVRRLVSASVFIVLVAWILLSASLSAVPSTARVQPQVASAAPSANTYQTRYVFVVSIGGLRASEAFDAPDPALYIPHMWNRLRPLGSLYTNLQNLGATWTTPANHTIAGGCWEMTPNNQGIRPFRASCPTIFEYYRRANRDVPQNKVWAVVGAKDCKLIDYSDHPLFGRTFAASLSHPRSDHRSDSATWTALQSIMDQHHPSLVLLQLGQVDHAAYTGWESYLQAIGEADQIVNELWDKIQSDPYYRDQTALLVTTSHGRDDDDHGGFQGYGGICQGCKRLFLLALGPDIKQDAVFTEFRQQTDICPTVGELMAFDTPFAAGRVLQEMIVGHVPQPQSEATASLSAPQAAWQDETQVTHSAGTVEQPDVVVDASGLHVVWVDDRNGHREVYYKARSSASGEWSNDLQLSTSGMEARAPAIASDGQALHVVWQDYRDGNWAVYYRRRGADGLWSLPSLVSRSTEEQGDVRCEMMWEPVITACQGKVLVAVPVSADRMRVFRRDLDGSWSAHTVVDAPDSRSDPARPYAAVLPRALAMACSGDTQYLFWQQAHDENWTLLYARSADSGASWGPNTYFISPISWAFFGNHDPSVAAHGVYAYLVWIYPVHDLWYSVYDGSDWTRFTVLPSYPCESCHRGGQDLGLGYKSGPWLPDVAAAPGMAVTAWEDYRDGVPAIYLSRSTDNGGSWQEQKVSHGSSYSLAPAITTDGQSVYVVWRDRRDGSWQLYLAEVSDVGPVPTPIATPTETASRTATTMPTATATRTGAATVTPVTTGTRTPAPARVYLPIIVRPARVYLPVIARRVPPTATPLPPTHTPRPPTAPPPPATPLPPTDTPVPGPTRTPTACPRESPCTRCHHGMPEGAGGRPPGLGEQLRALRHLISCWDLQAARLWLQRTAVVEALRFAQPFPLPSTGTRPQSSNTCP